MRLTLLGTGGVWAAPVHGCACPACAAARRDPSRARAPSSALLEAGGRRYLIDAGRCDLNDRFPPGTLDGVLLTHFHADHAMGLTLMRWSVAEPLPVWCPDDPAGFDDLTRSPGRLRFHHVVPGQELDLGPIRVTAVALSHTRPTLGWVIECDGRSLAWLSDTRGLEPATIAALRAARPGLVLLDCAYPSGSPEPRNHNDLAEAEAILTALEPPATRLIHVNHELDAALMTGAQKTRHALARDGEVIDL